MMSTDKIVLFKKPSHGHYRELSPNAAHARIYCDWKHLPSFNTLNLLQRVILTDSLMGFSKLVGNEVRLTASGVQRQYRVGRPKASAAIVALEERGWIQRTGLSPGPTGQAGGVYEILCITARGMPSTGPYTHWKP